MIKKAAVINDLSGFGKCSLTAAIAVLSVMGVQPCPLPTAVLTNQTGFENHYCFDFSENMHYYTEMWQKNNAEFDGIYSGYIADKDQVDFIENFINTFKKSHTRVIVDPVMADDGRLYSAYNKATCKRMKELAKKADIITPNLTELCILAGEEYSSVSAKAVEKSYFEYISGLAQRVLSHSGMQAAVTGIKKDGFIYNGFFENNKAEFFKSRRYGTNFSGAGDIFASIICGSVLKGEDTSEAVLKATKFLEEAIADTAKEPTDPNEGINLEKFLYKLA